MRVALVHDFLVKLGGAERVLKSLSEIYPDAPIFCLLYDEEKVGKVFDKSRIRTSFLQDYPKFLRKRYPLLLPKIPRAVEEFNLEEFDLVISSNTAYAHGVIVPMECKHVCYCHSPIRFAWDWSNEYREEKGIKGLKTIAYSYLMKRLRVWDRVASDRPDLYVANSDNVKRRIKKYYDQDSVVVYPPVEVERFASQKENEDYFLIVSTLTPYKRIDLAIELFNKLGRKLIIIGSGSDRKRLEGMAEDNIEFLGFKEDEVVKEYMRNCRAFIFPGEDDFGITPVEAMACGKPVLAYGKGGALETVVPGETGELFDDPTVEAMEDGLGRLLYNEHFYSSRAIRKHAQQFSSELFKENFKKAVDMLV